MALVPRLDDLTEIEQRIWSELEAAAQSRGAAAAHAEWRSGVLATVDQGRADARQVVLREVDATERRLGFFTDARSPKVAQIEAHPQGVVVFWSPALGWQLRVSLRMVVETSGLAVSSRWARLQSAAVAGDYLSLQAPGSPLAGPAGDLGTRSHFALIVGHVEALDWLELHPQGHRRALFDLDSPRWIQP